MFTSGAAGKGVKRRKEKKAAMVRSTLFGLEMAEKGRWGKKKVSMISFRYRGSSKRGKGRGGKEKGHRKRGGGKEKKIPIHLAAKKGCK